MDHKAATENRLSLLRDEEGNPWDAATAAVLAIVLGL
jgi:hypothetical protein